MNFINNKRISIWAVTFFMTAFLISAVTATPCDKPAKAKDRGRGRGNSRQHPNQEKKNDRFVNGHDARDGRLDGRGPKPKH